MDKVEKYIHVIYKTGNTVYHMSYKDNEENRKVRDEVSESIRKHFLNTYMSIQYLNVQGETLEDLFKHNSHFRYHNFVDLETFLLEGE